MKVKRKYNTSFVQDTINNVAQKSISDTSIT